MSKNKTITHLANEAQDAITAFFSAVANAIDSGEVAFTAPTKPEPGSYTTEELEEMDIKSLRDLAKRHGLDTIKKAEIIEALASDEDEEEDEEEEYEDADASADSADEPEEDEEDEEDEGEADEEGDEDSYSREELEEMSLRDLRALAKETGYTAADIKGLDQDALIDLLLGEDEDEDEGDEDEADDADEDESDESEEELTEDDLRAMDLSELKEVAAELGVKVTRTMKKDAIVEAILESAE